MFDVPRRGVAGVADLKNTWGRGQGAVGAGGHVFKSRGVVGGVDGGKLGGDGRRLEDTCVSWGSGYGGGWWR